VLGTYEKNAPSFSILISSSASVLSPFNKS